jgi:tRNA 2-thiouridine synthesizing protein A
MKNKKSEECVITEKEREIKKVNVLGETCPAPLVKTRKAILKASPGEVIEVIGDHPASKEEIPMAIEEMGFELISIEEDDDTWKIKFKVSKKESE